MSRKFVVALLAAVGMFVVVSLVDRMLAEVGRHAEATYIDDFLLAAVTGALVLVLQLHHERELARQRQSAIIIEQMNHHIRNALQVIVYRMDPKARNSQELREIRDSIDRIDWALREILPAVRR
jgi:divalent metal cation (Fe/Co/Zn/Cd) transporter